MGKAPENLALRKESVRGKLSVTCRLSLREGLPAAAKGEQGHVCPLGHACLPDTAGAEQHLTPTDPTGQGPGRTTNTPLAATIHPGCAPLQSCQEGGESAARREKQQALGGPGSSCLPRAAAEATASRRRYRALNTSRSAFYVRLAVLFFKRKKNSNTNKRNSVVFLWPDFLRNLAPGSYHGQLVPSLRMSQAKDQASVSWERLNWLGIGCTSMRPTLRGLGRSL